MNTNKKFVFGIDLGTTNSSISLYTDAGPEVLLIDGHKIVPSVVAFKNGQFYIGHQALEMAESHPEISVFSIKRFMGRKDHLVLLDGQEFTPISLSAEILRYLKQGAEAYLRERGQDVSVSDVVITVPAYFRDLQRRDTLMAGKIAGLNILRIINEPTAAALAYDFGHIQKTSSELSNEKWMIFDWGGGTFDISILQVRGTYKEVITSVGDNYLGGDDLDYLIVDWMLKKVASSYTEEELAQKSLRIKLKKLAETAKIELSQRDETHLVKTIQVQGKRFAFDFILTRHEFEELASPLIEKTLILTEKALKDADLLASDIKKLLFVGGTSQIPMVKERVEGFLGLKSCTGMDPNYSVAQGASIQGAICSGLEYDHIIIDIAPYTLGVAVLGEHDLLHDGSSLGMLGGQMQFEDEKDYIAKFLQNPPRTFAPVIEKNTKLPAKMVKTFYTSKEGQRYIPVAVFQGESSSNEENSLLGTFLVEIKPVPIKTPVHLGMQYDLNGMVKIQLFKEQEDQSFASFSLNVLSGGGEDLIMPTKPQIKNALIEKIRPHADNNKEVDELLQLYMGALQEGHDDMADHFEESLAAWMDQQDEKR